MDKYIFSGPLGADAETKPTANGKQMVTFSVAIDKSYKDVQGNKVAKTKWVSCVRFIDQGKTWGVLPYLKKGTKVLIEGEPDARGWINQSSGDAQAALSVNVHNLELMGSAPQANAPAAQPAAGGYHSPAGHTLPSQQTRPPQAQPAHEPDSTTDDLPF